MPPACQTIQCTVTQVIHDEDVHQALHQAFQGCDPSHFRHGVVEDPVQPGPIGTLQLHSLQHSLQLLDDFLLLLQVGLFLFQHQLLMDDTQKLLGFFALANVVLQLLVAFSSWIV